MKAYFIFDRQLVPQMLAKKIDFENKLLMRNFAYGASFTITFFEIN
jgi:hypothetical protein